MPRKPTGRRRGGQPGNHNRLKHGLYTKKLSIENELRLDRLGLNRSHFTIALAQARLNSLLERQAAAPPKDFLTYERAIQHYMSLINRLIERNSRLSLETRIPSYELLDLEEILKDH